MGAPPQVVVLPQRHQQALSAAVQSHAALDGAQGCTHARPAEAVWIFPHARTAGPLPDWLTVRMLILVYQGTDDGGLQRHPTASGTSATRV